MKIKNLKKKHKYQIALKEFLNLVKSSNNNTDSNNTNANVSKTNFLPYL